jgi:hypothetical protein
MARDGLPKKRRYDNGKWRWDKDLSHNFYTIFLLTLLFVVARKLSRDMKSRRWIGAVTSQRLESLG